MTSQAAVVAVSPVFAWAIENLQWLVAGLIPLACLGIYGLRDLFRFSIGRTRAISSVCFAESIRKRVLWLTPLAIAGVIVVSQFQRPLDEMDAIRQTTKFCLFAAGLLVMVASIMLACTSLPKEIENRVIYTVVTKPISRLEILVGKIAGFAGVSATILLIMGLFTFGYLHVREWAVMSSVQSRLAGGGLDAVTQRTLQFYADNGLLDARSYSQTRDVQALAEYSRMDAPLRWMMGDGQQDAYVPFVLDSAALSAAASEVGGLNMSLVLHVPWRQRVLTAAEVEAQKTTAKEAGYSPAGGKLGPQITGMVSPGLDMSKTIPAFVRVGITDAFGSPVAGATLNGGKLIALPDATGQSAVEIPIPAEVLGQVAKLGRLYVQIGGMSPGTYYGVTDRSAIVLYAVAGSVKPTTIYPKAFEGRPVSVVVIHGRNGTDGQQIRGYAEAADSPVGVFSFRGADVPVATGGRVSFEYRGGIERGDDDLSQMQTQSEFRVVNIKTGKTSEAEKVPLESRRAVRFSVPAEDVAGGDFDVVVKCGSEGHWLGLRGNTLQLISVNQGFGLNLFKSLLILWLLSVLVVGVSIFCSTFLSWPIAVVLTLVILLGHWGVMQLSDVMAPGVGRQVVNDLFTGAAPPVAETINRSLEALSSVLRGMSLVLPDISRFAAMEDMEKGVTISGFRILEALEVLGLFGLPILALSYVFFRNKEVAP